MGCSHIPTYDGSNDSLRDITCLHAIIWDAACTARNAYHVIRACRPAEALKYGIPRHPRRGPNPDVGISRFPIRPVWTTSRARGRYYLISYVGFFFLAKRKKPGKSREIPGDPGSRSSAPDHLPDHPEDIPSAPAGGPGKPRMYGTVGRISSRTWDPVSPRVCTCAAYTPYIPYHVKRSDASRKTLRVM